MSAHILVNKITKISFIKENVTQTMQNTLWKLHNLNSKRKSRHKNIVLHYTDKKNTRKTYKQSTYTRCMLRFFAIVYIFFTFFFLGFPHRIWVFFTTFSLFSAEFVYIQGCSLSSPLGALFLFKLIPLNLYKTYMKIHTHIPVLKKVVKSVLLYILGEYRQVVHLVFPFYDEFWNKSRSELITWNFFATCVL